MGDIKKQKKAVIPSAGLSYLITYIQDEAPVFGCVHLTGCFLCKGGKKNTTTQFKEKASHFKILYSTTNHIRQQIPRENKLFKIKKTTNRVASYCICMTDMPHNKAIYFLKSGTIVNCSNI